MHVDFYHALTVLQCKVTGNIGQQTETDFEIVTIDTSIIEQKVIYALSSVITNVLGCIGYFNQPKLFRCKISNHFKYHFR